MSGIAACERSHPGIVAEVRGTGRSGAEYLGVVVSAALFRQHSQNCSFYTEVTRRHQSASAFAAYWGSSWPVRELQHCPHDHLPEFSKQDFRRLDFDDEEEAVAQMRAWEEEARR